MVAAGEGKRVQHRLDRSEAKFLAWVGGLRELEAIRGLILPDDRSVPKMNKY